MNHARSSLRGGRGGETLHVTWEDLRSSEERGRWWRVGASWAGKDAGAAAAAAAGGVGQQSSKSQQQLGMEEPRGGVGGGRGESLQDKMSRLAAKQRMNTDVRRSIFCSIMTATDYEDAFERLMRLNLTYVCACVYFVV